MFQIECTESENVIFSALYDVMCYSYLFALKLGKISRKVFILVRVTSG